MSSYDLLVGISNAKLDQAMAQIYANPHLRTSVFAGSKSTTFSGVIANISWDVQASPTFRLRAPTDDDWKAAIKDNGNPAAPTAGAFLLDLSKLALQITAAGENLATTIPVTVICAAQSSGAQLALKALAVQVNLSKATAVDRFLITNALIPGVLGMVNTALAGFQISAPSFAGITLSAPAAAVASDHVLLGFNLAQRGAPDLNGADVPGDPFFLLLSPAMLQLTVNYEVQTNLQGKPFSKNGSSGGGGFSANYDASGSISHMTVSPTGSPLTYRADTSLSLTASAGIDLPIGFVIEAGNVIANAAKTVVEKIIDPDTWNPTKW